MPRPRVFLSYSRKDSAFAHLAKVQLEARDIEVWLDRGALRAGDDWANAIEEGIASSEALIVVLSPNLSASSYVTFEWAYALGKGKKIIPVLIEDGERHPKLKAIQHIDFTDIARGNWDALASEIRDTESHVASNPPGPDPPIDGYEQAKNLILDHLARTGYERVSFITIRESIDPAYTDEFLMDVIRRNRSIFRRAKVKGKGPGVSTDV